MRNGARNATNVCGSNLLTRHARFTLLFCQACCAAVNGENVPGAAVVMVRTQQFRGAS